MEAETNSNSVDRLIRLFDQQIVRCGGCIGDFNQKSVVVVISVHLGAHDLDPMDSEDSARCHEEPSFLYCFQIQWAGFFLRISLHYANKLLKLQERYIMISSAQHMLCTIHYKHYYLINVIYSSIAQMCQCNKIPSSLLRSESVKDILLNAELKPN